MLRLSKTKEAALPSPIISDTTQDGKRTILLEDDAVLEYYPDFLNEEDANTALKELLETVPWGEHKIYRKASQTWVDQPRLTAWIASDKAYDYTYSGLTLSPHPMTPALEDLKKRIDALTPGSIYDGVLLNNYRNGKDSVNWHSDEDPTLVEGSTIASVSLGCVRDFVLRHKDKKLQHLVLPLKHGSLLLMKQNVQKFYLHSVPKKQGLCSIHNQKDNYGSCTCHAAQRLNLTFRHYKRDDNANQQPNNNNKDVL